jgi:hypothetical protein
MSVRQIAGVRGVVAVLWACSGCPGDGGSSSTGTDAGTSGTGSPTAGTVAPSTGPDDPTVTPDTEDVPTTGTTANTTPTTETTDPTTETTVDPTTDTGDTDTGGSETVTVHLVPQAGVSGMQRINFAVPLAPGELAEATAVTVRHEASELPTALRGLARHPDGSWRSVQVQVDLEVAGETDLEVEVGTAPSAGSLAEVPVADTLVDDATGPRVWALLPAQWLSASGVAGPLGTEEEAGGTAGAAWANLCDYETWGHDAFIGQMGQADVWLYDRGTIHYRGHARRGDLSTLRSAYLETTIYRNGLSGAGADTEIGVPGKVGDAKYYYSQNLALHYLLTGDDRFRESAEDVAEAYAALWSDPGYAGGDDFWTERHAGFALLAYVWAMIVSDDQAEQFRGLADEAVTAYIDVQETYPVGYADTEARCFAHSDVAAGEDFGFVGCSPWLSAILADGLDQYATESPGAPAMSARTSLVKLGRIVARDGLDPGGKPFYWMNVGNTDGAVDDYDEHWGESAYVVAMAYHHDGAADPELAMTAEALITGLADFAEVPHMRSFNWQCRSAVATPYLLAR